MRRPTAICTLLLSFFLSLHINLNGAEDQTLYTKVFNVNSACVAQALAKFEDKNAKLNVYAATTISPWEGSGSEWIYSVVKTNKTVEERVGLEAYFASVGADISPPKIVFFNDRLGEIMVRASSKDLEIIGKALATLDRNSPQVLIETKLVEMDEATLQSLGFNWAKPAKQFTAVLTETETRSVLAAIKQHAGANFLSTVKKTTLGGTLTHVTPSMGDAMAILDVLPTVSADGFSIQMVLLPALMEFIGYDKPQAGTTAGLPHFRVRQVATTCNLWDGQTGVFCGPATILPGDAKKVRLVFVTATIIDATGKPIGDKMPSARTSIPPQPLPEPQ